MTSRPSIVWFRQDLRLSDNEALLAAVSRNGPVVPVYIHSPEEEGDWKPGAASRWWLHHSLQSLNRSLQAVGSGLVVRTGGALEALRALATETGADSVFWNRRCEPAARVRDRNVREQLTAAGIAVATFNSSLLFNPARIRNKNGEPFQVFTPFWKACCAQYPSFDAAEAPSMIPAMANMPESCAIDDLGLLPEFDWAAGMREAWSPGERDADARLGEFLEGTLAQYPERRDRPDIYGVSRFSPHLHFGEIGPRQIWNAVHARIEASGPAEAAAGMGFLRQLGWREFAYHLLYHFPNTPEAPLRPEYKAFPWRSDSPAMRAWRQGRTGYPLVDAGMRELWTTGWIHNRVRMVVASFLVKDLLIPWQSGARWFWDTLVDADLANNTLGWQWTAGCGADAAPYFRIFNPVKQGEKFDQAGDYVRRWVPELRRMPAEWIHRPWEAPESELMDAGVTLGDNYPERIIEHDFARQRALGALASMQHGGNVK